MPGTRGLSTRHGVPEAVLLYLDDLEGLETTLEVLADAESVAAIAEALAERERGEPASDVAEVRAQFRGRHPTE